MTISEVHKGCSDEFERLGQVEEVHKGCVVEITRLKGVELAHKDCVAEIGRLVEVEEVHKVCEREIAKLKQDGDGYRDQYNDVYAKCCMVEGERDGLKTELDGLKAGFGTLKAEHDELIEKSGPVAQNYIIALETITGNDQEYEWLSASYKKAVAMLKENGLEVPDEIVFENVAGVGEGGVRTVIPDGGGVVCDGERNMVLHDGVVSDGVNDPVVLPDAVEGDGSLSTVASGGSARSIVEVPIQTQTID